MADVKLNITGDASGAVQAAQQTSTAMEQTSAAVSKATDDAERYNEALRRMATADALVRNQSKETAGALARNQAKEAADELERYNKALEEMAQRQAEAGGRSAGALNAQENDGFMAGVAERRGALGLGETAKDAARDVSELAEKTSFLSLKKSDLKKLVNELGREFPVLGQAARLAMNPMVAALALVVTGAGYARKALADWNVEMDRISERNAQREFLPGIEAKAAAMREAAAGAAEFAISLRNVGKDQDDFANKIKLAIDKLHELVAAQAEVANAQQAQDLARVNLDERMGRISPEEAIARRGTIKERYAREEDKRKTAAEDEQLRLQEIELAQAQKDFPGITAQAVRSRAQADELKAQLASARADLPGAKAGLTGDEEAYAKASAAAEAAARRGEGVFASGPGFGGQQAQQAIEAAAAKAKEEEQAARDAVERRRNLIASLEAKINQLTTGQLPEAEAEAQLAQSRATRTAERIQTLTGETEQARQTLPIRQGARAEVAGLRSQTAQMETQATLASTENGRQVADAAASADALNAGQAVTGAQAEHLMQLASLLTGNRMGLQQAAKLMATMNDDVQSFRGALAKIEARMAEQAREQARTAAGMR